MVWPLLPCSDIKSLHFDHIRVYALAYLNCEPERTRSQDGVHVALTLLLLGVEASEAMDDHGRSTEKPNGYCVVSGNVWRS